MNSTISLKLKTEGAKRLQGLFQSAPEWEKAGQAPEKSLPVVRRQTQSRSGRVQSGTLRRSRIVGYRAGRVGVEAAIWIICCVLAIVGVVKAAYSEEPLLWLAVWPAPIVIACTGFIFFSQGFHFQDGVLILGRRCD
jgi:hypothetical protein